MISGKTILLYKYKNSPVLDIRRLTDRSKCCCFTGHRTENLPANGDPDDIRMKNLEKRTAAVIRMLTYRGYDTFITGMARGYDLIAAQIVMEDPEFSNLKLICALPYPQQYREMTAKFEQELYYRALNKAEYVIVVNERSGGDCYKNRNQFMVDNSSALIGYLSENHKIHSGSGQTFRMAQRAGLKTYIIRPSELEE